MKNRNGDRRRSSDLKESPPGLRSEPFNRPHVD
jgi:hypothetical protein